MVKLLSSQVELSLKAISQKFKQDQIWTQLCSSFPTLRGKDISLSDMTCSAIVKKRALNDSASLDCWVTPNTRGNRRQMDLVCKVLHELQVIGFGHDFVADPWDLSGRGVPSTPHPLSRRTPFSEFPFDRQSKLSSSSGPRSPRESSLGLLAVFKDMLLLGFDEEGDEQLFPLNLVWIEPYRDPESGAAYVRLNVPDSSYILEASTEEHRDDLMRSLTTQIQRVLGTSSQSDQRASIVGYLSSHFRWGTFGTASAEYAGSWCKGQRCGYGTFSDSAGTYIGSWFEHCMHGWGCRQESNGAMYEGYWRAGRRQGPGRYQCTDGAVYEGCWLEGKRSGKGAQWTSSGGFYRGEWLDNTMDGWGQYCWPAEVAEHAFGLMVSAAAPKAVPPKASESVHSRVNESYIHEGKWSQGRQHGLGSILVSSNSSLVRLLGLWDNGRLVGESILLLPNGDRLVGTWQEDVNKRHSPVQVGSASVLHRRAGIASGLMSPLWLV
jgi:hypothetical protein